LYKEALLTPARPPERVKKNKKRRKMAVINQSRFKEDRRRHEERPGRDERKWDSRRGGGSGRGGQSHPLFAATDTYYLVAEEGQGDGGNNDIKHG
jgi:hypothetical protein